MKIIKNGIVTIILMLTGILFVTPAFKKKSTTDYLYRLGL